MKMLIEDVPLIENKQKKVDSWLIWWPRCAIL